jgi:flavin reductase (DIM6/NTAB) family NADH-FMN oxidoreductase RutF
MQTSDWQKQLFAALGRVPSGLFILTASRGNEETGLLTSWVQQCSFQPPLISVAIKRGRWLADWLAEGTSFSLNILDESQTDMIGHFGRGFNRGEAALAGLEVERRRDGAPILSETLGYLDCRPVSRHPTGDHDLFVCEVVAGRLLDDGRPMIHIRKSGGHY